MFISMSYYIQFFKKPNLLHGKDQYLKFVWLVKSFSNKGKHNFYSLSWWHLDTIEQHFKYQYIMLPILYKKKVLYYA